MLIPQSAWESEHQRFGVAGEGQADAIQALLQASGGTALNVGCGPQGHHSANLAKYCAQVVAIDHSLGMVQAASADPAPSNVAFVVAEALSLPVQDASCSHVLAFGLLGYIRDHAAFLGEFGRVLRRGGAIALTDSVSRPREPVREAVSLNRLRLAHESEAYCPAASGAVKRRRLCILEHA